MSLTLAYSRVADSDDPLCVRTIGRPGDPLLLYGKNTPTDAELPYDCFYLLIMASLLRDPKAAGVMQSGSAVLTFKVSELNAVELIWRKRDEAFRCMIDWADWLPFIRYGMETSDIVLPHDPRYRLFELADVLDAGNYDTKKEILAYLRSLQIVQGHGASMGLGKRPRFAPPIPKKEPKPAPPPDPRKSIKPRIMRENE